MKKKIIILGLTIVLGLTMSLYLKSHTKETTFQEQYDQKDMFHFSDVYYAFSDVHPRSTYHDDYTNIYSVEDLFAKSDFIGEVQMNSRQQKYNIIETDVTVLKCYKGKKIKEMTIYEPAYTGPMYDSINISGSMPLMKESQRYLVFLIEAMPKDHYFNFINTCLGCYPIKENIISKKYVSGDDSLVSLSKEEVEQIDFLDIDYTFDYENFADETLKQAILNYNKQKDQYKSFKETIFKKLDIKV